MSNPTRLIPLWFLFALVGPLAAAPRAQELAPIPASEEVVQELLDAYEAAEDKKDAIEVAGVLARIKKHTNPEFVAPAKSALSYRASKVDKSRAKEEAKSLGIDDRDEIEAKIVAAESSVQIAGAQVLGNIPGKASQSALAKAFKNKAIRKERPEVLAAVIESMGRIGYEKALKDVASEYRQYANKHVMKASVRYFGHIKCKDKGIVRSLCENLDPPQPGDVNSAQNPPAGYWASLHESWSWIRHDVEWALKQITGQEFKAANGPKDGESKRALRYIKDHEKELGLR